MDVVADNTQDAARGGLRAIIAGVSYAEIVKLFGPPNCTDTDLDKCDVEWVLRTPAGPATLYNWKPDWAPGVPVAVVTSWHIGGRKNEVVDHMVRALGPRVQVQRRVSAWRGGNRA